MSITTEDLHQEKLDQERAEKCAAERRIDRDEVCCECHEAERETEQYARYQREYLCQDCADKYDAIFSDEHAADAEQWFAIGEPAVKRAAALQVQNDQAMSQLLAANERIERVRQYVSCALVACDIESKPDTPISNVANQIMTRQLRVVQGLLAGQSIDDVLKRNPTT